MKHLLILLISILLLSCPLFGQSKKKDLLYIWENGSRYVGEWKDGVRNGQGTYTQYGSLLYPDGRKYVGEYKNGKPNGLGVITFPDGSKFVGEYKDGEKNGQGT